MLINNTDTLPYQECGGTFLNVTGTITSPSYPNPYPNNAMCDYLISQPNGTFINLTVEAFDVEDFAGCSNDFLEVWNGLSEDALLLGKFCGNRSNIPTSFQSKESHLRLRYGVANNGISIQS